MRTTDMIVAFKLEERVTEIGLIFCIYCRNGIKLLQIRTMFT